MKFLKCRRTAKKKIDEYREDVDVLLQSCCLFLQASKRLESGEISQEDFLNMAHQIKHFFQYQEELQQQHSDGWDDSGNNFSKKQPLLTTPPSAQPRPHDGMDAAELSYYEHKSKLRKTQVAHRAAGEEWEGEESPEEPEEGTQGEKPSSGRSGGHPPSHKYSRAPRERPGEQEQESLSGATSEKVVCVM